MRPRAIGCLGAALLVCVLLGAIAAPPGAAAAPLPACALGEQPAAVRGAVAAALEHERRRYDGPRTGAFVTGIAAWLYGSPILALRATAERFPTNTLVGIGALADPTTRTVVSPNHDTLYSVSRLDLSQGPLVIDAPASPRRYSVVQLLDTATNAFAYVGSRRDRDRASSTALVPPGWRGSLPEGVRLVRSPSRLVLLLGRTLVDDRADLAEAAALLRRYALTPLAAWTAGERRAATVLGAFPPGQRPVEVPGGAAFFDALGAALAADPPPRRDACALRAFARAGIGPGRAPGTAAGAGLRRALAAAPAAGSRVLDAAIRAYDAATRRRSRGWSTLGPDVGRFGRNHIGRAIVARVGLLANVPAEALYPATTTDLAGRRLDGRRVYEVRFRAGELPPVDSFWSLTAYGADRFLVDNPIDRYVVGDRTPGLRRGRDGSLTIVLSARRPRAARDRANWLPVPPRPFNLILRLYEPRRAATSGRWRPPAVVRVG